MTFAVHFSDGFFYRFGSAAHNNDYVFRVGRAYVIEKVITSARQSRNLVHHLLNDCRGCFVISVGGFSVLEVSIAVLRRTFLNRVFGVERAGTEIFDIFKIDEFLHILVIDRFDLRNFVARSETVEEVKERNLRFKRRKVSDEREIHNFLNGIGSEHGKTRLTASHNVRVIAEDVEGMSG